MNRFSILSKAIAACLIVCLLAGCTKTAKPEFNSSQEQFSTSSPAASESSAAKPAQADTGRLDQAKVQISFLGQTFDGLYSGAAAGGVPEGEGTFTAGDFVYTGTFAAGSFKTGSFQKMPYEMNVGSEKYTGTLDGSITDGVLGGKISFSSFEFQFSGGWKEGVPSGYGQVQKMPFTLNFMEQTSAGSYTGSVDGLIPSGQGEYSDGVLNYKGSFVNGIPEDGDIVGLPLTLKIGETSFSGTYNGQVVSGTLTGKGTFTSDNFSFEGIFRGGVPADSDMVSIPYTLVYQDITYQGTYTGPVSDMAPAGGAGVFDAPAGPEGYYLYFEGTFAGGTIADGALKTNGYHMIFLNDPWNGAAPDPYERIGTLDGQIVGGVGEGACTFSAVNNAGNAYTLTGPLSGGRFHGEVAAVYYLPQGELHVTRLYENGGSSYRNGSDWLMHEMVTAAEGDLYRSVPIGTFDFMNQNGTAFMFGEDHSALLSQVDGALTYDQFYGAPDQYPGKLMQLSGLTVANSYYNENSINNMTCFEITAWNEGTDQVVWITLYGTTEKLAGFTFDPNDTITVVGMPVLVNRDESYRYLQIYALEVRNDTPPAAQQ